MNKHIRLASIAIAASIGLSNQALASNFSYTYLEISANATYFEDDFILPTNFGFVKYEGVSGASLVGSYQFTDVFYVFLSSNYLENSSNTTELNIAQSLLGFGTAFAFGNNTDINFGFGAASVEAEACFSVLCIKDSDTGLGLQAGIRHMVTNGFEISAVLEHNRFSDLGGLTTINTRASWWLNNTSSVFFGLGIDDDSDTLLSLGYRYTFSRR